MPHGTQIRIRSRERRFQRRDFPAATKRHAVELVEFPPHAASLRRDARADLGFHDRLHERGALLVAQRRCDGGVDAVGGSDEDSAGAGDAVEARRHVDCGNGFERINGLRRVLCRWRVEVTCGDAFGVFLLPLLGVQLPVQHVPEVGRDVREDVAVLREEQGAAFGHEARAVELCGDHGFAVQDVAGVDDFGLEFGDALDEAGGVEEPLAEDGVLNLGAGRVALGREDGEEAAVGGAFVVDEFEKGVCVFDVLAEIADLTSVFGEGAAGHEDVSASGRILRGGDLVADAVEWEGVGGGTIGVGGVQIVQPVKGVVRVVFMVDYRERFDEIADGLGVLLEL